jgi:predicted deacylase
VLLAGPAGAGNPVLPPQASTANHEAFDLLDFGAAFGTELVMKTTLPPGYHGILSIEAVKHFQRPFFHVEVGGGDVLWEHLIEQGVTGLRNLLVHHGMLLGKLVLPREQFFLPGRDALAMSAPIGGLLTQHVTLGQTVVKGQSLATINNPLSEKHAVIRARTGGIVHDLNVHAKVNAGEDVAGVIGIAAFPKRGIKPWRNSPERRINHPSKTVRIRKSQISNGRGLCWQPDSEPQPQTNKP